jgi:adenine-specific DNA-methyltransferase
MAKGSKRRSGSGGGGARVDAIKHKDSRTNIPTSELRDFVKADEEAPTSVLYPRDPSLDPQLVWKGKDEQDSKPLEAPVVPIYVQEKIHPQAIVEDIRQHGARMAADGQLDFFNDFNGLDDFDKKVDFYHHPQHWSNRMILGDSLLVMTSLAEKEGLKGKVQSVFMDPPYGIKFGSNWQVSTRKRDVKDSKAEDASRQPEQVKAFRDTWRLGIHSYLEYLRDRLVAARELISETGSIFVQIGDENVHLVRSLLDAVFGSENAVSLIAFRKTGGTTGSYLPGTCDYVLWYGKDVGQTKYRSLFRKREHDSEEAEAYNLIEMPDGVRRRMTSADLDVMTDPLHGRRYQLTILTSPRVREARTGYFPIMFEGQEYLPTTGEWKTHREGIERLLAARRIDRSGSTIRYVRYLDDFPATILTNAWMDVGGASDPTYVVQTNTRIVERCVLMTTDTGDLVLDPTCGSGTTAVVSEQWGRRWITIDTSRVALALARTRVMSAKFPYYLLVDSEEGRAKERELRGAVPPKERPSDDIRKGFVCKRVPHVTLKSIANNPDIREGMSRAEIDAAIARHAETETLHDQPYEDAKRIRVTGPFTVESLSPHRVHATNEPLAERPADVAVPFETMILDNLRKAGVQNTVKNERLVFDRLDPFAGSWLQGAGEYTDKGGKSRRVAISIGPEHGTVAPQQIKEAAKEAVRGVGFDLLIVCGFAFDPHVSEETRQYGKLAVLTARMNPDLTMGEELLKKTGTGNLFMVFGEPDVDVRKTEEGKVVVEIKGLDVYDPTTGQIRSSRTEGGGDHDIACWFLDTDYDGESFFVRHAYFTGADEPYEKLKRALRAEVDEAAWQTLYSTTSRPFDVPSTGKVAVKVINHYGDEVLKAFKVT